MENLLKESGKFFKGLKLQTFCLLLTSTLLFANHSIIFELIPIEKVVVDHVEEIENDHVDEFKLMPLAKVLVYEMEAVKLPNQFVAKCFLQVGFYVGIFIGLCFGWIIFRFWRPKIILLTSVALNAIFIFGNGFVPYFWSFVIARILVGFTVAVGQIAIALLFIDWSFSTNQPLTIHYQLSTRCLSLFCIGIMLYMNFSWRKIFFVHPCSLIAVVVLNLIFVNESPRWLRTKGKLDEFRNQVLNFAKNLGKTTTNEHEILLEDENDPKKHALMPSPPEILQLIVCYTLNALASMILQGSSGFYLSWNIEIILLASMQLFGSIITTPFYSQIRIPIVIFTTCSIMLTILLIFLPHGIYYGTILQVTKFNAILNDHFMIFFIFNLCSPIKNDLRKISGRILREWRSKLLLGLETFATISRILAIFFVLQKDDSIQKNDRIPKLAICIACYGIVLLLILVGFTLCSRQPLLETNENDKPLIEDPEKPTSPILPPSQPTNPNDNDEDTVIVNEEDDEVDIDI
uniref:Major facilitator superfamily (MFS) profile domain-containing protein n=1 Tax=Panagrolaimus sp. JU765 TaxID=591449 RepID=A0AC34RA47_9BILA